MIEDHESTDLEGAAKLAADEAMPEPPPSPSEYADREPLREGDQVRVIRPFDDAGEEIFAWVSRYYRDSDTAWLLFEDGSEAEVERSAIEVL
jgi:hypothetical protein